MYLKNIFVELQCLGQTWYLANDMQFYILSPLIIFPIWKSRKLGLALAGTVYIGLTFLIGYLVIHYELPPSITFIGYKDLNSF
jgi:peptidoglycan/LPS O-acetylase OafA/YrhL